MTTREAEPRTAPEQGNEPAPAGGRRPRDWPWQWAVVVGTAGWLLWAIRAELRPAQFQDDSSVHEQMVRFAATQWRAGHDPLTSWFPYLGLGSPQFMHYQS